MCNKDSIAAAKFMYTKLFYSFQSNYQFHVILCLFFVNFSHCQKTRFFCELLHKFAVWGRPRISLLNKRNSSVPRSAHETVLVRSVSLPQLIISRSLIFGPVSSKAAFFNPPRDFCSLLTYHAVTGLFTDN